jgi:hypothetical protein
MQATMAMPEGPRAGEEQQSALVVILVALLGVLLALALKSAVQGRSTAVSGLDGAVTLEYPSAWVFGKPSEGALFTVSDPRSPSSFSSLVTVRTRSLAQGQELIDAATSWALSQNRNLREFTDLGSEATTLAGRTAIRLNYAYVAPVPDGAGRATLPVVARATDTLVIVGNQVFIFGAASDAAQFERYAGTFDRILSSITLAAK